MKGGGMAHRKLLQQPGSYFVPSMNPLARGNL